ncbi:MAG: aminotransferase class V-fold PLP-dependent enzyme [Myxococcota bacterium]
MTAPRAVLGDRSLFPNLRAKSYLNHAAISPLSCPVASQIERVVASYQGGGLEGFKEWLPQRARFRESLGALLGVSGEDIGFVQNTSAGVTSMAFMLPWKEGDRIVLFEGEFPANVTPWQQAAATFGLEITMLPLAPFRRSWEEGLASLETELTRGVRLVAMSAVQFQTGLRMPIEDAGALCHRYGTELFVDAIQALGAVPLRVDDVDYLSCGAHKWLMGVEGVGFVYVNSAKRGALIPRLGGWLGHEAALDFLFLGSGHLRYDRPLRREANVVEQGAQSVIGLAAWEASVDLIRELGVDAIFEHISRFHAALEPALKERGFESARVEDAQSATLSVKAPPGHDEVDLAAKLGERGVAVSTPDGYLRFAPHWPNSLEEVPLILEALDAHLSP